VMTAIRTIMPLQDCRIAGLKKGKAQDLSPSLPAILQWPPSAMSLSPVGS
jgi:hypothetical protein